MTLLLHIIIALASLAASAYVFFRPSRAKLRISYGLVAATIASGTVLLISSPSHMVQACLMGLLYTGVTAALTIVARNKLAADRNS